MHQLGYVPGSRHWERDAEIEYAVQSGRDLCRALADSDYDWNCSEVLEAAAFAETTLKDLGMIDPAVEAAITTVQEMLDPGGHRGRVLPSPRQGSVIAVPSRRARCATDLALRLLSPVHRQRYREEWAAELAALPRRDQAPYAFRLLSLAWSLRRELSGKPARNPRTGLVIVGVVIPSADAVAALCGLDWPAAVVGLGWMLGLAWVVSSKERTQHFIDLIREARNSKAPTRK